MNNNIVLIENDPDIAEFYQDILKDSGYDVTWFQCGTGLNGYLDDNPPDLLILDYQLKDQTGFDVLMETERDVPYLIISGYIDKKPDYPFPLLLKPIKEKDLLTKVKELIKIPPRS